MKNKTKLIGLILFVGITILGIQSCKKYDNNQLVNLNSRTERVANTWKVENYKLNGDDYTSVVSNYSITYTKEGNYSFNTGEITGSGTWVFQNKDEEIKTTSLDGQDVKTMVILKLEEKEFWYYYMVGENKNEFHLIQK